MEWLLVAALAVFGWFQTDRLHDAQADADKWQAHAQSNYHEWQEAKEANDTNTRTIAILEKSGAECTEKHLAALDAINDFSEVRRINQSAIDELQRQLAERNLDGNAVACRVPDWVYIEGLDATQGIE